jgi:outer membrane biosynthesis protein TonB
MTAVMRAVAQQQGPKVLRIGIVQAGRVVEERIIKQRTTVTVGQSEKAMFVIPAPNLPSPFKLFELIGTDYYLNWVDGMQGRLALATGISDLGALRGQAKRVGPVYQIRVTDEARGKVVVGETTFLFQFVAPPPPQPRPQLPLAVKGGVASQIDWNLTIIAAFSFLLHFGFIGALYSDWMDPPVGANTDISSLLDMAKQVPPVVVEEKPDTGEATKDNAATKKDDGAKKDTAAPGQKMNNAQAAALSQQAEAMQMQMLAAFGGQSAVQGALNRSDIPPVDLSGVAQSGAGVSNASGDLRLSGGGGALVRPGAGGGGLSGLGATQGGGGGGSGKQTEVKGPTGDAQIGASTASVAVAGADRVIAQLRPGFRSCYNKGLQSDPSMQGKVTVAVKISPNGDVSSVEKSGGSGLSSEVETCIMKKIKNASFDAPGGSGSTLQVPITFVQQGK